MVFRPEPIKQQGAGQDDDGRTRRWVIGSALALAAGAAVLTRPSADVTTAPVLRVTSASGGAVASLEHDGTDGIWSWTGSRNWASEAPPRLRISRSDPDHGGGQHFMIIPYQYGAAIEYNGVVECWVDEWSIHNNTQGGDGGGASFWVGNHDDTGGCHTTAHKVGSVKFAQIASELFDGSSGGDIRFVVRDSADSYVFRSGPKDSEQSYLRISATGQLFARWEHPEEVWVGAAGPEAQAGIGFGLDTRIRLWRDSSTTLRTDARFVADDGLGLGGTEAARSPRRVVRKFQVFDETGTSLGYVPIYDRID